LSFPIFDSAVGARADEAMVASVDGLLLWKTGANLSHRIRNKKRNAKMPKQQDKTAFLWYNGVVQTTKNTQKKGCFA